MANSLPFTNTLLKRVKQTAVRGGLLLLCTTALIGCGGTQKNLNSIPQDYINIETQAKIDLNSEYAKNVNNFIDINTGHFDQFTPEEQAGFQTAWEDILRVHPDKAQKFIEFVVNKNNGKRLPFYCNANMTLKVEGKAKEWLEKRKIKPILTIEGDKSRYVPDVASTKYSAGNGMGFGTISRYQAERFHYVVKDVEHGKKTLFETSSHNKIQFSDLAVHEISHAIFDIITDKPLYMYSQKDKENFSIGFTNAIRESRPEPTPKRASYEYYAYTLMTNLSLDSVFGSMAKYGFIKDVMEKDISFPKNTTKWQMASKEINDRVDAIYFSVQNEGISPTKTIKQLQTEIEKYVEQNLGQEINP